MYAYACNAHNISDNDMSTRRPLYALKGDINELDS